MERVIALVPAAGRSRRMGCGMNKVFLPLGGLPVLARTLRALQSCADAGIAEIIVAIGSGDFPQFEQSIRPHLAGDPPVRLVTGGEDRQSSVYQALQVAGYGDKVLVHDGARPLVTPALVRRCLTASRQWTNVVAALPVKDTIKEVIGGERVRRTLDRNGLWAVQTPQVFPRAVLLEAHQRALADGFTAHDDAALVERLGHVVWVVPGDERNLKITTPFDLTVAAAWLEADGVA